MQISRFFGQKTGERKINSLLSKSFYLSHRLREERGEEIPPWFNPRRHHFLFSSLHSTHTPLSPILNRDKRNHFNLIISFSTRRDFPESSQTPAWFPYISCMCVSQFYFPYFFSLKMKHKRICSCSNYTRGEAEEACNLRCCCEERRRYLHLQTANPKPIIL